MTPRRRQGSTRRQILLGGAAAGLWVAGDMRNVGAAPAGKLRPDINSAAGKKMTDLYAKAVTAMQRPEINYPPQPQSWIFQSYIHGVPSNPFDPANSGGLFTGTPDLKKRIDELYGQPASGSPHAKWKQAAMDCWATCTHESPYFPTWHRWYLYYFERICREMCGDPEFMLPYWNYASNIGHSLQLPAQFRSQNTPLLFDDRGLGFANPQGTGPQNVAMNSGGYMPYPLINYNPALTAKVMFPSDTNFFSPPDKRYYALGFTGRLECVPHDMVHDNVGGWMGNVPSAAGDPIFFMHHCQIDRLYASWEAESGVSYNWGNGPTDPSEQTWKGRMATFADEKGNTVKVKLGDAVSTDAMGYGYDNLAKPPPAAHASALVAAASPPATFTVAAMRTGGFGVSGGGGTVTLQPEAPRASAAPVSPTAPDAAATATNRPTTLILHGLKLLRRPPAPLSVFLNLPNGTQPELNGPYYVGPLNLFNLNVGTGKMMAHGEDTNHAAHDLRPPDVQFDVGDVLGRQQARGLWDGGAINVTVTTMGVPLSDEIVYVTFDSAELVP
jgi:tyrosinase